MAIIKQQVKADNAGPFSLELGYTVLSGANGSKQLEPVVDVMDANGKVFAVDAVTGQILKGGEGA